ncbi:hypothetical protein CK203_046913 [Vitis vinifera]|uniref:Serine aminopeptidase S33 domain-containing protein n=1 Tax=Vitis vinifera TaxID=29760 RepID=A0A438HE38_VITVI|nr:hypothetical protein CK203_046913 [Vitis vinifera]
MALSLVSPVIGVEKLRKLRRGFGALVCGAYGNGNGNGNGDGVFPSFLPKQVEKIKDPFARSLAQRIQRLPVQMGSSGSCIMSSCVKPVIRSNSNPVVLLHCFDSSCLEWRCTYPLLEEAGLEAWAVDVLGWGFSDLERLPPCDVASKRHHLYQLWKSHIKRPVILVGPSLGAAVAIDFAVNYPEAVSWDNLCLSGTWIRILGMWNWTSTQNLEIGVHARMKATVTALRTLGFTESYCPMSWLHNLVEKLVLIGASVYAEGTGNLSKLYRPLAYAGVSLSFYATENITDIILVVCSQKLELAAAAVKDFNDYECHRSKNSLHYSDILAIFSPLYSKYTVVSLLKSFPLRLCSNLLAYKSISFATSFDWTNVSILFPWLTLMTNYCAVGLLHCLLPWWEDATVNFMKSGGYNVIAQIKQVWKKFSVLILSKYCA